MTTFKEYEALCQKIWYHNRRYYVEHAPEISDKAFDSLLKQVEAIEAAHPEWITPASPTQRVGEMLTEGFKTVEHTVPMLSLANTYNEEELTEFIERMKRLVGREELVFSCELKMDGIAISALYKKGLFIQGVTRGDGKKGDDITHNMKTIVSLPLRLYGEEVPELLEVRGEVFLPADRFLSLNKSRQEQGKPLFANPRNAAAGTLKLLDPKEAFGRGLAVVFYGITDRGGLVVESQFQLHQYLKKMGLPILAKVALCHTQEEILAFAEEVKQLRPTLPFQIDGVVVKLDTLAEQKRLGSTGKHLRWAVAYKFAAEQATTRIQAITVQVGRSGVLTPVAELEPVSLAGSTISRATLHNADEVARKDLRVGDLVTIEKGGDVIPKVVAVHLEARPKESRPWKMPSHCPSCGTPVEQVTGEVAIRCPNLTDCRQQRERRVAYFASKGAMDIEHLGGKIVEQLIERGFVQTPADLYALTADQLRELDGFKERAINNLLISIDRSRHAPLARFLVALGIKYVGSEIADILANATQSLDRLAEMGEEELTALEGVGPKVAASVVAFFSSPQQLSEIKQLLARGVHPQPPKDVVKKGHPFAGKSFVLTGALGGYTRQEASSLIKARGGKVIGSVSKNTDYLLVGKEPGSKLQKAEKLGVTLLDEEAFERLL